MNYFIEILFVFINLLIAFIHARQWKNSQTGKPFWEIKHGWWAFLYLGLVMIPVIALKSHYGYYNWLLGVILIILRKPVFDCSYNYYRGYGLFYVSKHATKNEASSTSIIDDIHWKLFKNKAEIYQPIYLFIALLLNYFIK
jgi:hypothetical protein